MAVLATGYLPPLAAACTPLFELARARYTIVWIRHPPEVDW